MRMQRVRFGSLKRFVIGAASCIYLSTPTGEPIANRFPRMPEQSPLVVSRQAQFVCSFAC
jgi:hypothetical protein